MRSGLLLLALLAIPSPVEAKGEAASYAFCFGDDVLFAYEVVYPASAPGTIVVATNFGLLVSRDSGATFGWVCPEAYGAALNSDFTIAGVPGVAVLPDATVLVISGSLYHRRSFDDLCRYELVEDMHLMTESVVAAAFQASRPGVVYVSTAFPGLDPFGVYRSMDNGLDYEPTGLFGREREGRTFGSLLMTPGGERVYAMSRVSGEGFTLHRTDDEGVRWEDGATGIDVPTASLVGSPPGAPGTVYIATATNPAMEPCMPTVQVQRSIDDGDSFVMVHERADIPVGAAVRSDGSVITGFSVAGVDVVNGDVVSPLVGVPVPLTCVAAGPDGSTAFGVLRRAPELVTLRAMDGALSSLVRYDNILGPLDCPAGTPVADSCEAAWANVSAYWSLGPVAGDGGPGRDGGPVRDGAGDDGGPPDDGGSDGATDGDGGPVIPGGGGCGCRTGGDAGDGGAGGALVFLGALLFLLVVRRRRSLLPLLALAALAAGCGDGGGVPELEFALPESEHWRDRRVHPPLDDGLLIITNNFDDTVSIVDYGSVGTTELVELARVPVGLIPVEREGPHHVAAAPDGQHYYVAISNYVPGSGSGPHGVHGAGDADGYALKVRATDHLTVDSVRADPSPGDIRLTPDGETLLVSHFDLRRITEVLSRGGDPSEMDAFLVIIDPETMTRRGTVRLCPAAHGIAVSPDSRTAYTSCLDDQMAVVDLMAADGAPRVIPVLATPGTVTAPICEPYAMTVAPDGGEVWVSCFESGELLVYDVAMGAVDATRTVRLPGPAVFASFNAAGDRLYVPHQVIDGVAIVDPATSTVLDEILFQPTECQKAHAVMLTDDEARLIVVCEGDHEGPGSLLVVELASGEVESVLELGRFPDDVALLRPPR